MIARGSRPTSGRSERAVLPGPLPPSSSPVDSRARDAAAAEDALVEALARLLVAAILARSATP